MGSIYTESPCICHTEIPQENQCNYRHSPDMDKTQNPAAFEIRAAAAADSHTIARYNSRMALETEGKALADDIVGPGVLALLDDPTKGRYWVAEADGRAIGQLMVTYEWSDWRNGTIWWIQSVYVHPDWRRRGVFSALYRHVESLVAATPGVIGLRLYVEENNQRAQQTYEALGMTRPSYIVMESLLADKSTDPSGEY
jgi:ribosomal protein S18 acetylase RimI-like enzyme